ncbi:MAG: hypothetical protein R3E99_19155 [Burkholderiaceae bacterium]
MHKASFEALSGRCTEILQIDEKLQALDYRQLADLDYFELIDRKVLSELVHAVVARTITAAEVEQWVRQRWQSHWFENFEHVYLALEHAAQFMHLLDTTPLEMGSLDDGVRKYAAHWFRLISAYRKFIHHLRELGRRRCLGNWQRASRIFTAPTTWPASTTAATTCRRRAALEGGVGTAAA